MSIFFENTKSHSVCTIGTPIVILFLSCLGDPASSNEDPFDENSETLTAGEESTTKLPPSQSTDSMNESNDSDPSTGQTSDETSESSSDQTSDPSSEQETDQSTSEASTNSESDSSSDDDSDSESSPESESESESESMDDGPKFDLGTTPDLNDDPDAEQDVYVFTHTALDLLKVHPETLEVELVGPFGILESITDIALDADSNMIGISFWAVYSIDVETGQASLLSSFPTENPNLNGLSYIDNSEQEDLLIAASNDGNVYKVDPETGMLDEFGQFGSELMSSGDLVFLKGLGAFATASKDPFDFMLENQLVKMNTENGSVEFIGDTGFSTLWGLGFWGGTLYGFSSTGEIIEIDPNTGVGTMAKKTEWSFWGGGVTTTAPLDPPELINQTNKLNK